MNVPTLRFPGFDGEWKEDKLCSLFNISAGGDIESEYVSSTKSEVFKYPIYANAEKDKGFYGYSSIYKVDENVVTVAGRGANLGIAHARNHKFYPIVRLLVLKPKNHEDIYFFEYQINRIDLFKESTGVPQLTAPQISNYFIKYPALPEQTKIASFLSAVDEKLQQLKKKKELLLQYKQGMMQKIFSQEIRFKDDEGNEFEEWEEKTYEEFAPLQRGFDLPVDSIVRGDYPVVFSNGILKYHNEYKAKAAGVVTGRSGTIGNVTYVDKDYWPHNTSLWVTDFKGNYPKFVYYFLINFKLERFATGSGVPTLNRNDIHVQKIYCPTLAEQLKISYFLTALDEKINHCQTQIAATEQYKKALLQQMFC